MALALLQQTYPVPDNGGPIVSVPVDGFAGQLGRLTQFLDVDGLGSDAEYGRPENNHTDDGTWSVRSEIVVGRTCVAAGMVLVHLCKKQTSVHLVEYTWHIVRIEK